MPNITDLFSSLLDSLNQLVKPSGGLTMQMSWPGFGLSPGDFKLPSNPAGPYDPQVAEETVSQLADMIPAASEIKYESSGFEVHNIYEALVFGAMMPAAAADAPANPLVKLFLDAQFEFVQAEKGSVRDPQEFYYPAKVTPSDWYNEANANWAPFSLDQPQIKTATAASPFVKLGGQQLVNQGVLRVASPASTNVQIRAQLQTAVNAKVAATSVAPGRLALGTMPVAKAIGPVVAASPGVIAAITAPSVRTQVLSKSGGTLADSAKLKTALADLHAQRAFKASIQPKSTFDLTKVPDASLIDVKNMSVSPAAKLNVSQRVNLDRLIVLNLPVAQIQNTSDDWKIQFRYCYVQINRNWLNSTLLSLPNWFFPGTKAGYFSTAAGENPPQFPLLPQAFLAIRDLRINAKWSDEDLKNITQSVSFGPFDLRSKTVNQNEVRVDGLQIIAWFSRKNPALAPMSDPTV